MNHNFADWELTQLLPFKIYNVDNCITDNNEVFNSDKLGSIYEPEYKKTLPAWTWEDIRLYLKEKGYEFFIRRFNSRPKFHDKPYHCEISINGEWDNDFDFWYSTYEEARRKAIKYCLSLIKET